jgi:hypothetical protein
MSAVQDADHLIICTPVLADIEAECAAIIQARKSKPCQVLHLGTTASPQHWVGMDKFMCLEHLFALQSEQNELKQMRIKKALLACQTVARDRVLMDAITIVHGWEDLASFC